MTRAEAAALPASFRTRRDSAIAGLMLYSGLRSAEVLGLQVTDVDIGGRCVRVPGKGNREQRVPRDQSVLRVRGNEPQLPPRRSFGTTIVLTGAALFLIVLAVTGGRRLPRTSSGSAVPVRPADVASFR